MRSGSEVALAAAKERWNGLRTQISGQEIELAEAIFSIADILVKISVLLPLLKIARGQLKQGHVS